MAAVGLALVVVILFLLVVLMASVKIVKEYERGVVFRLGLFGRPARSRDSSCCCRSSSA